MQKFVLVLTLWVGLTLASSAQEEQAKSMTELANSFGSHLAYAQARLLNNKHGLTNMASEYKLSRYSLHSDLYGGFTVGASEFKGSLDIYTGKRAIDETLQLESIDALEDELKKRTYELSQVEPLKIKSHPWKKMLEEVPPGPALPEILKLAPEDHLMVYFHKSATLGELEAALQELVAGAEALFDVKTSLSIRQQVAARLGVQKFQEFEALMGETVFVSEDLDFFPNTHYALIFKGDPASQAAADLLLENDAKGRVGEYFVVASSQALLERIRQTHGGKVASMYDSLDFRYANAVLDKRRHGLVYLSEAFILKLVSPAHRINAARRLGAIERVESRQYAVLAYRCLTGAWPKTFHQMVKEGYLKAAPEDRTFTISPEGIVDHKIWGNMYDIRPLSEAPIIRVTKDEKRLYESFLRGYERFWRAFFDPIGVAFRVDKELYFHTIILPLINNSDYRDLERVAGGEPARFHTLSNPLLRGPVSLHSRLNFDDIALTLANGIFSSRRVEPTPEAKAEANRSLNRQLGLEPPVDFFNIVGDEFSLSLSGDFDPTEDWGAEEVPVWLSVKLTDKENFRRFAQAAAKNGGGTAETKIYGGIEYIVWPFFSDLKLYLLYRDDYVHITFHEPTLKKLAEAAGGTPLEGQSFLGAELLGLEHNVLWRGDFGSLDKVREALAGVKNNRDAHEQMTDAVGYALDIKLLAEALGGESEALRFFRCPPRRMYGVPLNLKGGELLYGGHKLEEIDFTFRYVTKANPIEKSDKISLLELVAEHSNDELKTKMAMFDSLSVGLEFTPEGLSTKIAVNNPKVNPPVRVTNPSDHPPTFHPGSSKPKKGPSRVSMVIGLFLALLVASLFWRKKPEDEPK